MNARGLRIASFEQPDGTVVAEWQPRPEHEAFDGFVNGGVLATLVDCHSNWTGIAALLRRSHDAGWLGDDAPSTVTADLAIRYRRPTPLDQPVRLVGRAVEVEDRRVVVETTVESGGEVTARARATFVEVGPGHPAYGRW